MSKFKIRQPESFDSYQAWIDADGRKSYRQKINKAKSELEHEQKRYNKLDKQKRKLYSGSSDFDKTKQVKEDFEQSEKNIEKLQKKISDLQDEAEQAELDKQKLKIEFLKDAAEYMDNLLDEFLPVIDRAAKMKDNIRLFGQFDDLRAPAIDNEALYYYSKANRKEKMFAGFKQRYEAIVNGEFEPRELQKLKQQS